MSNAIADILKAMVENTTIVMTSDLPSLLQHEEVYQLRRVHKDQILQNLPEALQALYEAVKSALPQTSLMYREDVLAKLSLLFGVADVGNLDVPEATNSQPQLADNRSVKVNPKYDGPITRDEVREFRDPFGGNS